MEKLNLKNDKRLKGFGKIENIVIIGIDDINNKNVVLKLRGVKIDILYIPKQYKNIFNKTKLYNQIAPNLMANSDTTTGEIRYY